MSSPKKRMVPEDGGKSPVTQLNSVVLPAPLEPSTARRSPGRTVMVTSVSAASAPNIRVTPRNSSAAVEPNADSPPATLSMTAPARAAGGRLAMTAPAIVEADHTIGRPEHDGQKADANEQAEAVAVETDLDQEIERKGTEQHEDQRADEGPDRPRDAADDRDDE